MKFQRLLLLTILSGCLFFISCNKDDGDDPVANQVTFDGTAYVLVDGLIYDYGSGSPSRGTSTHYNYDFYISDDQIVDGETGVNATILIYAELFAAGSTGFSTGTFTYTDRSMTGSTDGNNFFDYAQVVFPNGTIHMASSGTITVSGTEPNYSLDFNLNFPNSVKLTGSYTGTFEIEVDQ